MPAPKMLSGLPKPALFGLYGAAGGLIGALFFGEIIMLLLGPRKAEAAPPPKPEPRLAVTASKELQLYQGGVNKLFVEVLRDEFNDPVKVRVEGLPAGVTASEATVPAGGNAAEVELRATFAAKTEDSKIRVVASARPGGAGKDVTESAGAKLSVLPSSMPQADIVFVLDVTSSMAEQIKGLQTGITKFAGDLSRAKVDARFGCVAFRDLFFKEEKPEQFPQMTTLKFGGEPFTADADAFRSAVRGLEAYGGDDIPETSYEAVAEAAGLKGWRKDATRVLVLVTDAPP